MSSQGRNIKRRFKKRFRKIQANLTLGEPQRRSLHGQRNSVQECHKSSKERNSLASWSWRWSAAPEGVVVVQFEPKFSFPKPQFLNYSAIPARNSVFVHAGPCKTMHCPCEDKYGIAY